MPWKSTLRATSTAMALAGAVLVGVGSPAFAGARHDHSAMRAAEKARTHIYRAWFPNAGTGRRAAVSLHHALLESDYAAGFLVFELEPTEVSLLTRFGFRVELAPDVVSRRDALLDEIEANNAARRAADPNALEVGIQSIPNYSCYETVEETFVAAQGFASSKPQLALWVDAGDSWQKTTGGGYDIGVLVLTNSAIPGPKPKLFINSAIHAREYTTAPLVLEFAHWLFNGHGSNADATWILDHHEVHLMLHANPDGRKEAEAGLSWRKNTDNAFCANTNDRGVDLNRNFTFAWNSTGGSGSSGDPCDLTYLGPSAGSEPETQAVENYIRSLWPDRRGPLPTDAAPSDTSGLHLDIHSYSQLVLWPWGSIIAPAPNGTALQTLGRRFAFHNGYTPMQSIGLYPTDGTSDGPSYGELGVPAFTFELGTSFLEDCTSYDNVIKPNNLPALIYAAKVVRAPYQIPGGPDITALAVGNGSPVPSGTPVSLTGSVTDTRFNQSYGAEPIQTIVGAEAYIDTPPWALGAVAIPLSPADGAFDSPTEVLTASLTTSGLSIGRHMVFVRGVDASGQAGPVTAAFLDVSAATGTFCSECLPNRGGWRAILK